ncbi:MAG: hypothetical protein KQH63_08310 [Desulfobulbaceae bacterium]|nr:hypothetical protein [Desulfobulbaceae bacterium]
MLGLRVVDEVFEMSSESDWHCWNIMQCNNDECLARKQGNKPCWEVASEFEDYRTALNVCSDCLVYVSKQENATLSKEEIETILEKKGICILKKKCLK